MTDYVLEWMKKNDVPLTQENYLYVAYMGDVPDLDAESDSMLPPEIQKRGSGSSCQCRAGDRAGNPAENN